MVRASGWDLRGEHRFSFPLQELGESYEKGISESTLGLFSLGPSGSQRCTELLGFITEVAAVRFVVRALQVRENCSLIELVSANHQSGVISYANPHLSVCKACCVLRSRMSWNPSVRPIERKDDIGGRGLKRGRGMVWMIPSKVRNS